MVVLGPLSLMVGADKLDRMRLQYGALREIIETAILGLIVFLLAREAVQNFQVEGRSMQPTLASSELVLVNKIGYWEVDLGPFDVLLPGRNNGDFLLSGPHRGSVIIFRPPYQSAHDFVKRVIGMPGDTVEIIRGRVFVNGVELNEHNYIYEPPSYQWGPAIIPPEHYFVLGDNRNSSQDSHAFGPIHEDQIVGEVMFRWFPFDRISNDISLQATDNEGNILP